MVGKALNDPLKGLTALSKKGVAFSDSQKKMVAAMMKTGDVAGAQANPVANYFVGGDTADRGGVTVAAVGVATRAGVAVGSGAGNAARVRVYMGTDFTSAAEPTAFQDLAVFGGA